MAKVFLHTHDAGDHEWINEIYEFNRVPVEGEFVSTEINEAWYKVELVIHTLENKEMDAEVFAVKVDHNQIMKSKLDT